MKQEEATKRAMVMVQALLYMRRKNEYSVHWAIHEQEKKTIVYIEFDYEEENNMKKTNFDLVLYHLAAAQHELKKGEHDQLSSSMKTEQHWLIIDEAIEQLKNDVVTVKLRWEKIN